MTPALWVLLALAVVGALVAALAWLAPRGGMP